MSVTALKSTKWRLSSLNHQLFEFLSLVPKSPIHTGLISAKNPEPNISSLGPFKRCCRQRLKKLFLKPNKNHFNKNLKFKNISYEVYLEAI
jgi:hypothetical protein